MVQRAVEAKPGQSYLIDEVACCSVSHGEKFRPIMRWRCDSQNCVIGCDPEAPNPAACDIYADFIAPHSDPRPCSTDCSLRRHRADSRIGADGAS